MKHFWKSARRERFSGQVPKDKQAEPSPATAESSENGEKTMDEQQDIVPVGGIAGPLGLWGQLCSQSLCSLQRSRL